MQGSLNALVAESLVAKHKEWIKMQRRGWCCRGLKTFKSGRLGRRLLFAGHVEDGSGGVFFAVGSSRMAAERKVQERNSPI